MSDFKSKRLLVLLSCFIFLSGCHEPIEAVTPDPEVTPQPEFIERMVIGHQSAAKYRFFNNHQIFSENWDTLGPARFWQEVFALTHDSMIINVASIRQPLYRIPASEWHCQTESEKSIYKENLCIANNLESSTTLFVTGGKRFFFEFRKVLPLISKSIKVFEDLQTDPWYAQTILLIESPGKTEISSYAGARGPFQLMPYVARQYGLVVSRTRDDRTDLIKSATAASKLIKNICIPGAKRILDKHGIVYNEKDLWFRLLVMHVYHAGAGNVAAVVNKISPQRGGMELIRSLWVNEAAGFKNESQNYSQIALAAMIRFDRLVNQDTKNIYLVEGDFMMKQFHEKAEVCVDTLNYLYESLDAYGNDLLESQIPGDYYKTAALKVKDEIRRYQKSNGLDNFSTETDFADRVARLGNHLYHKRKYHVAIDVYHISLDLNPLMPQVYSNLGNAYKLTGQHDLAIKYSRKSKDVTQNPNSFLKSQ